MPKKIFIILQLVITSICFSLPTDKDKIIHFSAGEIEWNQQTFHGVFNKDVRFEQGTTTLLASSAYSEGLPGQQFKKIVLYGNNKKQAHFKTLPEKGKQEVDAKADIMTLLPEEKLIKLEGHVKVNQDRFHFTAPYVEYYIDSKKMITKNISHEETTIIIDPEKT